MSVDRYVALLRGINVGGRNRLPMADLVSTLTAAGFSRVRTYIQSGNVVFDRSGPRVDESAVAASVRTALEQGCGLDVPVLVRSLDDVERVVHAHPDAGGAVPAKWLHVFLLDREPDVSDLPDPGRFAPDRWVLAGREIYATYPAGSGRSRLSIDVFERAFGVTATARNLSTLGAIVELGRRT